eukprot:COSAG02_NODE_37900_length_436_cov_0.670623_1_plen_61_part_00
MIERCSSRQLGIDLMSPAGSATTDVEQNVVAHVKTCREKLGYPFKVVGSYGAGGCCFGAF